MTGQRRTVDGVEYEWDGQSWEPVPTTSPAPAGPAVLTVEEAAEILRIGRTAAYAAVGRGDIPSIRIGRSLRIPRRALDALLNPVDVAADGIDYQRAAAALERAPKEQEDHQRLEEQLREDVGRYERDLRELGET